MVRYIDRSIGESVDSTSIDAARTSRFANLYAVLRTMFRLVLFSLATVNRSGYFHLREDETRNSVTRDNQKFIERPLVRAGLGRRSSSTLSIDSAGLFS